VFDKCSNVRAARDRVWYAREFADCLLKGNYARLFEVSDAKREHILKAIKNYGVEVA